MKIHGQHIEMEERICKKCSSKFKLMKKPNRTINDEYCGTLCQETYRGEIPDSVGSLAVSTYTKSKKFDIIKIDPDYIF